MSEIDPKSAVLMRRATTASVTVAFILVITKAWAWIATGSVALLGSLVDSVLDLAASLINKYAVRKALTPADADHRFGHGKAEPIAGLFQAAFIAGSAVFLMLESVERLVNPAALTLPVAGILVSILAIFLTLALVLFQNLVVKRTGSIAVAADHLHYKGDLMLNAAVIVALFLTPRTGMLWVDGLFGIGIALYLSVNAIEIGRSSIDILMDKEFSDEDRSAILDLVQSEEAILGVHDLRTRRSGLQSFIQMHIEVADDLQLIEAHEIADRAEAMVRNAYPNSDVIIHVDPFGIVEDHHGIIEEKL